jgi:hypothetical protein
MSGVDGGEDRAGCEYVWMGVVVMVFGYDIRTSVSGCAKFADSTRLFACIVSFMPLDVLL